MPYAQFHYPFSKDGLFEKHFPADFIAEGIDQTRGWFYSLLAISTVISGQPSYRNCVSIEMILDKDGQKMSKSRGNVVEPSQILDNEGADALRWYLFTVSPPWVPTRFDREGVREVIIRDLHQGSVVVEEDLGGIAVQVSPREDLLPTVVDLGFTHGFNVAVLDLDEFEARRRRAETDGTGDHEGGQDDA